MSQQQAIASIVVPDATVPVARRDFRSFLALAAGAGLSVACLYLATVRTDVRAIWSALGGANFWFAVPLVLTQILFYTLKARRWRLLLLPLRVTSARQLAGPMMIGFMANNLLPARLGEVIRLHLGARQIRATHSQVLSTLVIERLFDLTAVLALFALAALTLEGVPRRLITAGYLAGAATTAAFGTIAVCLVWTDPMLRLSNRVTRRLPGSIGRGVQRQIELVAAGMAALRQPALLVRTVASSLLQWLLMAGCIYFAFQAVQVNAPFAAALIVLASTVFGVMVPAAPGYIGTLHLTFVFALVPFGVGEDRAMAAAVFYHVIPYACVILAGAYYVRQMGMRLLEIRRDALRLQSAA